MAEKTTWIKLDRNILEWRWYQDANTFRVFMHLLLTANIEDKDFRKETIHRGETVISIGKMAKTLGITYDQVRTALTHLKDTNEITIKRMPKYLVISITNYNRYQANPNQNPNKSQTNPNQIPITKEYKEIKNTPSLTLPHKPYLIPSLDEVSEYERESGTGRDPELFYRHYSALDWKANGKPIYDWKALYRVWEAPPQTKRAKEKRASTFTDEDGFVYEWVNGTYEVRKGKR